MGRSSLLMNWLDTAVCQPVFAWGQGAKSSIKAVGGTGTCSNVAPVADIQGFVDRSAVDQPPPAHGPKSLSPPGHGFCGLGVG